MAMAQPAATSAPPNSCMQQSLPGFDPMYHNHPPPIAIPAPAAEIAMPTRLYAVRHPDDPERTIQWMTNADARLFFKHKVKATCPFCQSNAFTRFRYLNNIKKCKVDDLQPRYTCKECKTEFPLFGNARTHRTHPDHQGRSSTATKPKRIKETQQSHIPQHNILYAPMLAGNQMDSHMIPSAPMLGGNQMDPHIMPSSVPAGMPAATSGRHQLQFYGSLSNPNYGPAIRPQYNPHPEAGGPYDMNCPIGLPVMAPQYPYATHQISQQAPYLGPSMFTLPPVQGHLATVPSYSSNAFAYTTPMAHAQAYVAQPSPNSAPQCNQEGPSQNNPHNYSNGLSNIPPVQQPPQANQIVVAPSQEADSSRLTAPADDTQYELDDSFADRLEAELEMAENNSDGSPMEVLEVEPDAVTEQVDPVLAASADDQMRLGLESVVDEDLAPEQEGFSPDAVPPFDPSDSLHFAEGPETELDRVPVRLPSTQNQSSPQNTETDIPALEGSSTTPDVPTIPCNNLEDVDPQAARRGEDKRGR